MTQAATRFTRKPLIERTSMPLQQVAPIIPEGGEEPMAGRHGEIIVTLACHIVEGSQDRLGQTILKVAGQCYFVVVPLFLCPVEWFRSMRIVVRFHGLQPGRPTFRRLRIVPS